MGDVADMMLDGTLCQMCGVYLGANTGYPVTCKSCKKKEAEPKKHVCPVCRKKFRTSESLHQHVQDSHFGKE